MIRHIPILGIFCLLLNSLQAQVEVSLSQEKNEYLLYEPIPVIIKVSNHTSDTIDMAQMAGKNSWLDFDVTTAADEQVSRAEKVFQPPFLILAPGEIKTVPVNLCPYYLIRDPDNYQVAAQVNYKGKTSTSAPLKFTVVKGVTLWKQSYIAPPDPEDKEQLQRPRLYSLVVNTVNNSKFLYVRIQNPDAARVYCTAYVGKILDQSEPTTRVDILGDLHVFHQNGTRVFTYAHISANGKLLGMRFFSNLNSQPKMVADELKQTQIIGGEEITTEKGKELESMMPSMPGKVLDESH